MNVSLHVGQTKTMMFPAYSDIDGDTVTVSTYETGSTTLPAYVTFQSGSYTFAPTDWGQAVPVTIVAEICDWVPNCTT